MVTQEQKNIVMNNINRLVNEGGKTQIEVAKAIGVSQQTFNNWCTGVAIPRMDKIEKLASYFGVQKSDLIEEYNEFKFNYEETVLKTIHARPEVKYMFDLMSSATKEDVETAIRIIEALKGV